MARFLATHTIEGLTEEQLREKLGAYTGGVSKWRPRPPHHHSQGVRRHLAGQAVHRVRGGGAVPLRGLDENGWLAR